MTRLAKFENIKKMQAKKRRILLTVTKIITIILIKMKKKERKWLSMIPFLPTLGPS